MMQLQGCKLQTKPSGALATTKSRLFRICHTYFEEENLTNAQGLEAFTGPWRSCDATSDKDDLIATPASERFTFSSSSRLAADLQTITCSMTSTFGGLICVVK